jgi:hypothetical protein
MEESPDSSDDVSSSVNDGIDYSEEKKYAVKKSLTINSKKKGWKTKCEAIHQVERVAR